MLMYMNWPRGTVVFLGISNKASSWPSPAVLDPSKTVAERRHFVKSGSKYSRVEMWVSWSTVHWDEPSMVPRAERLFSCLYFISQAKVYVSPMTSMETNSKEMSFGQIFWQMWWCSGNVIAQLDLFWPSSWHVNFHFCLLGVSVNRIFFWVQTVFWQGYFLMFWCQRTCCYGVVSRLSPN